MEKCANDCDFSEGCKDSKNYIEEVRLIGSPVRYKFVARVEIILRNFYKNLPLNIVDIVMTQLFLSNDSLEHNIHVFQKENNCYPCFNNMKILLASNCQVIVVYTG